MSDHDTITLSELHSKCCDWLGRYPGDTPVRIALNDPGDAEAFLLHPITRSWVYESPPDDDHNTTLHIVLAFPMPKDPDGMPMSGRVDDES